MFSSFLLNIFLLCSKDVASFMERAAEERKAWEALESLECLVKG